MKTALFTGSLAILLAAGTPLMAAMDTPGAEASEPADLSVEEVLGRHIEALGGSDAIEAIANIRIEPQVTEPTFSVQGDYRATRDGFVRVDIFAGDNRVFSEGIDAQGGWQQRGAASEVEGVSEAGYAALARGIEFNLFGLNDLASRGHTAELYGREVIDGINYYILQLTMADGFERYFYINPENWLIERTREVSALHPDLDSEERPAETLHYNYQLHCGVLTATETRKIDLLNGEQLQHTKADTFECNVDPAELAIERPEGPVAP